MYEEGMYAEALNWYYKAAEIAYNYKDDIKWYRRAEEGKKIKWELERREKKIEEAKRQAELELKRKQEEEEARKRAEKEAKRAEAIKIEARENYSKGEEFYKKGMYAEAVKWYRKAAEQGNALAQFKLGWMYRYGKGIYRSQEESTKWYLNAADQGNCIAAARAQHELETMFRFKNVPLPQNAEIIVKWFHKKAEQGNADAQYQLGYMHQYGKGVPQSYEEAVKWYRKAAEQNHKDALIMLAYMYRDGNAVPQSGELEKWMDYCDIGDESYDILGEMLKN